MITPIIQSICSAVNILSHKKRQKDKHREVSHFALNLFINKEKELHIIIQLKICIGAEHA
jgi:hypothetical protein